jgi:hypothetical protein
MLPVHKQKLQRTKVGVMDGLRLITLLASTLLRKVANADCPLLHLSTSGKVVVCSITPLFSMLMMSNILMLMDDHHNG